MKLVIVESPTKAKTIKKFLPAGFVVESSFGHIRDLPKSATEIPEKYKKESWARLGIDIEHDFKPLYIIPSDKKKQVAQLRKLIKEADELYLATDEDREGEAISWHLLEVLQPKVPVKRMVFHEITKEAILAALEHPRTLDEHLVFAQETRRVLDRLYGYEISPILWRKIAPKLSAGRVQSVAVHLLVSREKQRMAFHSGMYWDVTGQFKTNQQENFSAKLTSLGGKKLALGKDFSPDTGTLLPAVQNTVVVLDQAATDKLVDRLKGSTWTVTDVQQKPLTLTPKPPFITSTLQQDAGRKLSWSASRTMRTAQHLYEQGYITYMRTDSVQLSQEAIAAAHDKIKALYGAEFLVSQPRQFKNKNKSAQEAHEAIRPSGTLMRHLSELPLVEDEAKLYDLIWKRTVASQMADAKLLQTSAQLSFEDVVFQASGRVVQFAGFLKAYVESNDDGDDTEEALLPELKVNDQVNGEQFEQLEHHTKPPARYTEASLIKQLEADAIGRPSTYASIIDTIQRRGYVYKDGTALIPRFVGFAVDALLDNNFSNLVNTEYTAAMEEDLDSIAEGKLEPVPYLKKIYFGENDVKGLHDLLKVDIDARKTCTFPIGVTAEGGKVNVRVGRFGPFVELINATTIDNTPELTASIPADLPPDQLTVAKAVEFMSNQAKGPTALGTDPVSGKAVYLLEGRFGPYVQLGDKPKVEKKIAEVSAENAEGNTEGAEKKDVKKKVKRVKKPKVEKPKMKGLLKGMLPADVTLETALQLLAFPKDLGVYPASGESIIADAGRFGPYIRCGIETRSLSPEDNLLTLTFGRAVEMLNTPKIKGRRTTVAKELGVHPTLKAAIQVCSGRYGPYIRCGKTNVTIPKDVTPEGITLEQAVSLINQKIG